MYSKNTLGDEREPYRTCVKRVCDSVCTSVVWCCGEQSFERRREEDVEKRSLWLIIITPLVASRKLVRERDVCFSSVGDWMSERKR